MSVVRWRHRALFTLITATSVFVTVPVSQMSSAAQTPAATEVVRAINAPADPLPSEAASASITKFSFIAYGDTRGRKDGISLQYEHSLIADSMLATIKKLKTTAYPVRFIVQSGDAVVNGRDAVQWNRSYIDVINRLTGEGDTPYYFAPGNHDVTAALELTNAGRLEGMKNLLAANANLLPAEGTPRRLTGYPTYAIGFGNTFVLAIDSNISPDETQFQWVKRQLETLDRTRFPNVIAFMHHPPYSSGPHGGATLEDATAGIRNKYMPLFRTHHVRMTIGGHEHLFEHWVERYQDATGLHRMDNLVTGGGGAPLYGYQGEPNLKDYIADGKASKLAVEHLVKPGPKPGDNPYHYVIVQVDGDAIQLEVVGIDWGSSFRPYFNRTYLLKDEPVVK